MINPNETMAAPQIDRAAALAPRVTPERRSASGRVGSERADFVATPVSAMIWAALDYAVTNQSITLIEGDTGHGKTVSTEAWVLARPKLEVALVEAPAIGGTRLFLGAICKAIGEEDNLTLTEMRQAIFDWCGNRDAGRTRVLVVDQAHDLLPRSRGAKPEKIDFLRELHDLTGVPVGLLCTVKLIKEMSRSAYIFDQIMGRVGMPIKLPAVLKEAHYRPVVVPFFPKPSEKLLATCGHIANDLLPRQKGRLRLLDQVLRLAARMAQKKGVALGESHVYAAMALRAQMMGKEQESAT